MRRWLLALGWVGCGEMSPDPIVPDNGPFTNPEAPWLGEADDSTVEVDLGAVTDLIDDALSFTARLDATPLAAAYTNAMTGADAACPSFFTSPDGIDYWLDTCESASGARFDGFGAYDVTSGVPLDFGLVGETTTVGGSGSVVGPDGSMVDFNGFAQVTTGANEVVAFDSLVLDGRFDTDDPAADGTWLATGIEPELSRLRYHFGALGTIVIVNGVLDGFEGGLAVVIQQAAMSNAQAYSDCALEPSGVVSVRLASGWVDVLFDPVETGGALVTLEGACDGCGQAWSGTQLLGEVCPDIGPLLAQ